MGATPYLVVDFGPGRTTRSSLFNGLCKSRVDDDFKADRSNTPLGSLGVGTCQL